MNRTELKQQVRALGCHLEVDNTIQERCPACSGGSSGESSLSITRLDIGLLYHCYRASCSFKGFEQSLYCNPKQSRKALKIFKPNKFTSPTKNLSPAQYNFWRDKYGILKYTVDRNGIKSIQSGNSYMMPTMNEKGYVTGCVDRAFWRRKPKSLLYKFMNFPSLSFAYSVHSINKDNPILLVEDMTSAIKAASFVATAALLGTNISEKEINYLTKLTNTIWLALDTDATDKAIAYKRKYNLYFRNFRVLPLSNNIDIKDMPYNEIQEILQE